MLVYLKFKILEKITKNHFNYLHVIGKGGFGRVNFSFLLRFGKFKKKIQMNFLQ